MEIARLVGGGRPAFNEPTEGGRNGGDDTAAAVANGEHLGARRAVICFLQRWRQREPRAAIRIGHDMLGKVVGPQAEFTVP